MKLTVEKVIKLGFVIEDWSSNSPLYVYSFYHGVNGDILNVFIDFDIETINVVDYRFDKKKRRLLDTNDFTEERLEAILKAFQKEPIETNKEENKSEELKYALMKKAYDEQLKIIEELSVVVETFLNDLSND